MGIMGGMIHSTEKSGTLYIAYSERYWGPGVHGLLDSGFSLILWFLKFFFRIP